MGVAASTKATRTTIVSKHLTSHWLIQLQALDVQISKSIVKELQLICTPTHLALRISTCNNFPVDSRVSTVSGWALNRKQKTKGLTFIDSENSIRSADRAPKNRTEGCVLQSTSSKESGINSRETTISITGASHHSIRRWTRAHRIKISQRITSNSNGWVTNSSKTINGLHKCQIIYHNKIKGKRHINWVMLILSWYRQQNL